MSDKIDFDYSADELAAMEANKRPNRMRKVLRVTATIAYGERKPTNPEVHDIIGRALSLGAATANEVAGDYGIESVTVARNIDDE